MTNIFDKSQLDIRSNPNLLINGDFSVNQRGFNGAMGKRDHYTLDRYQFANDGTSANVNISQGAGHPNAKTKYINILIGSTGSTFDTEMYQKIEGVPVDNESVTGSFWAWNYSSDGQPKIVQARILVLRNSDNFQVHDTGQQDITVNFQDQNYWTGTGGANRYTYTLDIPRLTALDGHDTSEYHTRVDLRFPDNTKIQIAGYKLELGSYATPFVPDDPATNLSKCQRYYFVSNFNAWASTIAESSSSNWRTLSFNFPTTMRDTPTVTWVNSGNNIMEPSSSRPTPTGIYWQWDGVEDGSFVGIASYTADAEL